MNNLHEQLAELGRRIEAGAYARGKADMKAEMLAILTASDRKQVDTTTAGSVDVRGNADDGAVHDERQRAPRGAARTLAMRAMRMSGALGIEAKDACDVAENDLEQMVRVASIRTELRRGREEGRYVERSGRWFLAPSEEEAPTTEPAGKPAGASEHGW